MSSERIPERLRFVRQNHAGEAFTAWRAGIEAHITLATGAIQENDRRMEVGLAVLRLASDDKTYKEVVQFAGSPTEALNNLESTFGLSTIEKQFAMWEKYTSFSVESNEVLKETCVRLQALFRKGEAVGCSLSIAHRLHLVKKFVPAALHALLNNAEETVIADVPEEEKIRVLEEALQSIRNSHGTVKSRKSSHEAPIATRKTIPERKHDIFSANRNQRPATAKFKAADSKHGSEEGVKRCFKCNGVGHFKRDCPAKVVGSVARKGERREETFKLDTQAEVNVFGKNL